MTCEKCDGEGYVCILCDAPPDDCCCWEPEDDENAFDEPEAQVRRCSCNPRREVNISRPSPAPAPDLKAVP